MKPQTLMKTCRQANMDPSVWPHLPYLMQAIAFLKTNVHTFMALVLADSNTMCGQLLAMTANVAVGNNMIQFGSSVFFYFIILEQATCVRIYPS